MVESKLAKASFYDGSIVPNTGGFYSPSGSMDALNQAYGLSPEKLIVPNDYHSIVRMCYDFYARGGMASVVLDRIAELAITEVRNGQRKTSDEANIYYDALLHRRPSRLNRFLFNMSHEYWLTGMALPRVDWKKVMGKEVSPDLQPNKEYLFPTFDMYPPLLVTIEWLGWGEKIFFLKIPEKDVRLIKSGGSKIKEQQRRYEMLSRYVPFVDAVANGSNKIQINVDAIMRKETSFTPYPTPYLIKVLESLVFKQQLRRMDFAVASRIINAILLVQEGDKDFPITEETRGNLDELKAQILARSNNPALLERLFILFSNHTTKLTWIHPDVSALLDQDKYRQSNEEIMEGLGFPRILIVGESRGAQAAEVSTWAIQPQMEQLRMMILEWMQTVYEEAADLNRFRNTPEAAFTPIQLQDFVKTAAVFAQAYREGNISRTTRNQAIGLNFETEIELMADEKELMDQLPDNFPEMPYNIQLPPNNMNNPTGIGTNMQKNIRTGKTPGTTNKPVTVKNSKVTLPNQQPVSRTNPDSGTRRKVAESLDDIEMMSDGDVIDLINKIATDRGLYLRLEHI